MFSVAGRSREDDCVGVEEVDSLQQELEVLLASSAKRMQHIHNELSLLDEWIEKGAVSTIPTGKDKAISAASVSSAASQQVSCYSSNTNNLSCTNNSQCVCLQ